MRVQFHQLGARRVFHRDISPRGVQAIQKLQAEDPAYNTISTRQMDVCEGTDWGVDEPVDYIYLYGVLHHFYDPATAVRQMRKVLKPGGRCFFRIYRSGSLAFYVVDALRKIVQYADRDLVTELFRRKHPESHWQIYMGLYDDLFVPVVGLYDPKALNAYFGRAGLRVTVAQESVPYDHANTQVSGQGVSLFYEWTGDAAGTRFDEPFPPHIDQLTDIRYREPHIRTTNALFRDFIAAAPTLDRRAVIEAALSLHEGGQLYRYHRTVRSEEVHRELQKLLKSVLVRGRISKKKVSSGGRRAAKSSPARRRPARAASMVATRGRRLTPRD